MHTTTCVSISYVSVSVSVSKPTKNICDGKNLLSKLTSTINVYSPNITSVGFNLTLMGGLLGPQTVRVSGTAETE